jgi:hypothetical protein
VTFQSMKSELINWTTKFNRIIVYLGRSCWRLSVISISFHSPSRSIITILFCRLSSKTIKEISTSPTTVAFGANVLPVADPYLLNQQHSNKF